MPEHLLSVAHLLVCLATIRQIEHNLPRLSSTWWASMVDVTAYHLRLPVQYIGYEHVLPGTCERDFVNRESAYLVELVSIPPYPIYAPLYDTRYEV